MAFFSFKTKPKAESAAGESESRPGLIARMRAKLNRGDSWLTYDLANLLPGGQIDDAHRTSGQEALIADGSQRRAQDHQQHEAQGDPLAARAKGRVGIR